MKKNLKKYILAALFAALIFIACTILPISIAGGYIHLADGIIYIAACLIPLPYAAAGAAIGAAAADFALGYTIYIPGTLIIKALYVVFFTRKQNKILTMKNIIGAVFAGLVCVFGYYLYEVILLGSFLKAVGTIPWNAIQAGASIAVFILIAAALDKVNIKRYLL